MNNFVLLQKKISNYYEVIEIHDDLHPLYKRFFKSYNLKFIDRSLLDIAILLRQILLLENVKRGSINHATLSIPIHQHWPTGIEWKATGIQFINVNNSYNISEIGRAHV